MEVCEIGTGTRLSGFQRGKVICIYRKLRNERLLTLRSELYIVIKSGRSEWPRGLRGGSAAACLLRF